MTSPVERPSTPPWVAVVGTVLLVILGLLILKWIIGFAITIAKLALAVVIIVAIVAAAGRLLNPND